MVYYNCAKRLGEIEQRILDVESSWREDTDERYM